MPIEIAVGYSPPKDIKNFSDKENALLHQVGFENGRATVAKFTYDTHSSACRHGCEIHSWQFGTTVREPHTKFGDQNFCDINDGLFSETFGGEYMQLYVQGKKGWGDRTRAILLNVKLENVALISGSTRGETHIKASEYDVLSIIDKDDPETRELEKIYMKLGTLKDGRFFELQRAVGIYARNWQDVIDISRSFVSTYPLTRIYRHKDPICINNNQQPTL